MLEKEMQIAGAFIKTILVKFNFFYNINMNRTNNSCIRFTNIFFHLIGEKK